MQEESFELIKNYLSSQSYQEDFRDIMLSMLKKYGVTLFNLSGIGEQLDMNKAIKKMAGATSVSNGSVDANANAGYTTAITIMHEIAKPSALMQSYYRLWKWLKKNRSLEVANKFVEAQITGAFYVNDMHYISYPMPYCYNHSCLGIAVQGLLGIDSKNDTKPPKYLRSYFDIIEAYLLIAGNATAGATGISNLLVVASIFLKKMIDNGYSDSHVKLKSEEDCWQYFKEELTSFIYKLNQPCRGNQSLFSNISLYDKPFLEAILPEMKILIDDEVYGTDMRTVQRCQEIYIDVMLEESERVVHTFPVTTACVASRYNKETDENEIIDKEFLDYICKKNSKNGFMNIYSGDTATLSSCCRLRSDKNNAFFNSFGGASDSIGSMGVVCINLPQLAYKHSNNFEEFKKELHELVLLAQEVNYAKRCLLKTSINKGHLPLYTNGYMDLSKQFSTLGFVGLSDACDIFNKSIITEEGLNFAEEILASMEAFNDEVANKYKIPTNLEGIPAEQTAIRLRDKDKVLGFDPNCDLYSNQFIPLSKTCNLLDRIRSAAVLDRHCSGGSITHITVDGTIDAERMFNMAEATIKLGVKYFAFNYEINQCQNPDCQKIFVGKHERCPVCGNLEIERYMRIVGFLTKKSSWSTQRQAENRQYYTSNDIIVE